jgi:uncharacterized protein YkwD
VRALIATAAACALVCATAGTALAVPADRAAALSAYKDVQADLQVPSGWTGSVDTCTIGTESPESLAATLHTANTLRDFAGVAPVTFDDALNHKALAAALMMKAAGRLDHDPQPDWPCYSQDGKEGANKSDLALGISGAGAMLGFADDGGVPGLGHRRWLLDPNKTVFGSGSTGSSNALYVLTAPGVAVAAGTMVAWPSGTWFPRDWIPATWSLAVGGSGQAVEFQNPSVSMTLDGGPVDVANVTDEGTGFGTGHVLSWQPNLGGLPADDGDHDLVVTVSGVVVDSQPTPVSYTVKSFKGDPAPPPGGDGGGSGGDGSGGDGGGSPGADTLRFLARPTLSRRGRKYTVHAKVAGGSVTSYRWLRDGHRIKGAHRRSYSIKRRDRGHKLSCRVTASSPAGAKVSKTTRQVRVPRH